MQHVARCTNCIFSQQGAFAVALLANADLLAFLTTHGINPVTPSAPSAEIFAATVMEYDEEILATDPFEGRFTFTIDDDTLTLTVNEDLEVVDTARDTADE